MILVEGVGFAPLTFLLMSAVLRSTDASFEEAALMAGAGPLKTFRSITLRLGLPGVLALMLLVGIRAFESFEVPALVGLAGNVTVLTTNIYQSSKNTGSVEFRRVRRLCGMLLLIVVVLLLRGTTGCRTTPISSRPSPAKAIGRASSISAAGAMSRRRCCWSSSSW